MSIGSVRRDHVKKILYIENEAKADSVSFYKAALDASLRMGWEFHLAYHCLDYSEDRMREVERKYGFCFHQIDFARNPLHPMNFRAYSQLKKLADESFDLIHCNTPVGGVLGRLLAAQKRIRPVIYQAHGFHFYTGAPLINWLLYYPVEKSLARFTDRIITISREDYEYAREHLHPRSGVSYIPGVGIEPDEWKNGRDIRRDIGINENDFVILSVGRLERNKNCGILIDAVCEIPDIRLIFCGDGPDRALLQNKATQKGIANRVLFLGNRNDMLDIYHSVDCFVMASFREGLSRSIMEAMACGLPCIVSDIRGNRDLIDLEGGFLFDPNDANELAKQIGKIRNSAERRRKMGFHNREKVSQFSYDRVLEEMLSIYREIEEQMDHGTG